MTNSSPAALRLDLSRALREGMQAVVEVPVGQAMLDARAPRCAEIGRRLLALQEQEVAGFARLDFEAWSLGAVEDRSRELSALGETLLVLGIGGSALGARALRDALRPDNAWPAQRAPGEGRVEILDSLDPALVRSTLRRLDPRRTVVAAISKSGGTIETVSLLKVVQAWLSSANPDDWKQRLTFVTDPAEGAFREVAAREGIASLAVPPDVGGRFSVLTAVGMLPAAFLGLDLRALLAGGRSSGDLAVEPDDAAWRLAALHDAWWEAGGRVAAWMTYCDRLASLGAWFQQLWAESLGKRRSDGAELGWTPLSLRGPADQHSLLQLLQDGPRDKLVTLVSLGEREADITIPASGAVLDPLGGFLEGKSFGAVLRAEEAGTVAALVEAGRPVAELRVPRLDEQSLGALFAFFQRTVAYAGLLWDIDPFDQPGVEAGKRYASAMLGREGFDDEAARLAEVLSGRD